MKLKYITLFLVATAFLVACVKNRQDEYIVKYNTDISNQARLKFNINSAKKNNPTMIIKVNGVTVSNPLLARTPFPGGGYNTNGSNYADYLSLVPGNKEISISIPKFKTTEDSILVYKGSINIDAQKYYSLHVTDTADNVKTVLVEDNVVNSNLPKPSFTFINLMPNVPSVDLYYGPYKVASGVAYLSSTPEFTLDSINTAFAWGIREAGAATNLATYTSASSTLSKTKYTAFATGYKGLASPDIRRPYISFFMIGKAP